MSSTKGRAKKIGSLLVVVAALAAGFHQTGSSLAKTVGVELRPQNQQQLEASQLLVQGSQLLKAKQPFKARPLMEKAAGMWPDEPHVHFNLGACYSEMGDFPRAISEYEKALTIDPAMTECLPNIATCYQLMNEYDRAVHYFQEYLRREPHASDAQQIQSMIAALERQAAKQVDSDPQSGDYLPSVLKNGRVERWQRNRLPLRVFIANGTDDQGRQVKGFQEAYNETLLGALDTWVKASNYRLAYQLVDDAHNADIVCTWTDRRDFMPQGTTVEQGAARLQAVPLLGAQDQAQILGARVIILLINPSNGRLINEEELKKTCLHELGHALGLSGHSNNNRDIMFYSESPTVWAALTKRDKNTIARLYGDYPVFSWSTAGAPPAPDWR